MKKIILFVIINCLSFPALSAAGDLYYCEMIQAVELKEDGLVNYIPQKFKFRITEKSSIQFGMMKTISKALSWLLQIFQIMVSNFMAKALSTHMEVFTLLTLLDGHQKESIN